MRILVWTLLLAVACGSGASQHSPSSPEPRTPPIEPVAAAPAPTPVMEPIAEGQWTIEQPLSLEAPTFSRAADIPSSMDTRSLVGVRPRLRAFRSSTELRRFARRQRVHRTRRSSTMQAVGGSESLAGLGGLTSTPAGASPSAGAPAGSTTGVTTTQIAGIDEGDIVKAMGEHFLVLRQGVLYTVQLGDALAVKDRVSVIPDDQDGWIDELLVHPGSRRAVVIGFVEADEETYTVLHLFNIDDAGAITRGDAIWLRSQDYYDDENYATRLVGDDLIFYSIHTIGTEDTFAPEDFEGLPADEIARMREQNRWDATLPARRNERGAFEPTWAPRRIFVRTGHLARTLQAVTRCDLARSPVPCTTYAVIEDGVARLFVSDTASYLWVDEVELVRAPDDDASDAAWDAYDRALERAEITSLVYRFPHRGSRVQVAASTGSLSSMMHLAEFDGHLHALVGWDGVDEEDEIDEDVVDEDVVDEDVVDEEDDAEPIVESGAALLSFDLRRFARPLRVGDARRLPSATPETGRFLGSRVVYGASGDAIVHDVTTNQSWVGELGANVTRVDPLLGGVLVSVTGAGVEYLTVELGDAPTIREHRRLVGASGSETRTHGFFFLPSSAGHGTFGVPIVRGASRRSKGEAAIAFFDMADFATTLVGDLRSSGREVPCTTSCVDWYGNARPLFWQGGIYALMGSEIVAGARQGTRIVESGRVLLE